MEMDYQELGQRVAKRRKVLNLTQDDVSEATGLSNNHISNIENQHSIPSLETLMKLCQALDVTPDYLLLGTLKTTEGSMHGQLAERMKLCGEKKLRLIDHFVTWVIEEEL